MKTSFWAPYISDRTIHAICWTLIHSLWIGVIIALIAGLVISITRKSGAALRYNLLCGILMLFTLSVWVTFFIEMKAPAVGHGPSHFGQFVFAPDNHVLIVPAATEPHLNLVTRVVTLLNQYANVIFLVWLLLFVLKSLKMAGGLLYIQRIRNYKIHEVSEEFKRKIEVFANQIGISQVVRLMQSELVKVPVVVGWLKPVILLPMGVILQLPAEQVESILWHELAHIRRRDYLVNILQGLVETVFFFNPGLLWLSSLIRAEREACCDDIVLSKMNRKANYLEALLAFGNDNFKQSKLAMSVGSGNQLRDRMKRMIHQENKRLSVVEKVVLVAGLVVLSAFTGLPKTTKQAVQHLVNVMMKKPAPALIHKAAVIDSEKKQLVVSPQKMKMAVVDTPKASADTPVRFTSVLFKLSDADLNNNDITAQDARGKKYHFIVAEGKLSAMDIDGEKVAESDLPHYEYMLAQIDRTITEKRRYRQEDWAYQKSMSPMARYKADNGRIKFYGDSMKTKIYRGTFKTKIYTDSMKAKFDNGDAKMKLRQDMKFDGGRLDVKHGAIRKMWREDSLKYTLDKKRVENLIADLIKDKIVKDAASVKWFGLSSTKFIVNGQEQPNDVQKRYKDKFAVKEDYGLYYGPVEMNGTGVFMDAVPGGGTRGFVQPFKELKPMYKTQPFDQKQLFSADKQLKMKQFDMQGLKPRFMAPQIPLQDIVASIADELVKDNIVKDKSDLHWFNLTNSSLVVNGKTQSEEVHQKLKERYLKEGQYPLDDKATDNPNFGLHYNLKTGSMGLGIMDGDKGE